MPAMHLTTPLLHLLLTLPPLHNDKDDGLIQIPMLSALILTLLIPKSRTLFKVVSTSGGSGGESNQDEQQQPDPKENFLLCLYEKVHRTRNKWRCTFQNGILHVDGQEFVLGKINGEFEW